MPINDQGILEPSKELSSKRYRWLREHHPAKSAAIKEKKNVINEQAAHANVVNSAAVFTINDAGDAIKQTFFDIDDEYRVRQDLLLTSGIAIELMELLHAVNVDLEVVEFIPDFLPLLKRAQRENDALMAEMRSHPRFKRAVERYRIKLRK